MPRFAQIERLEELSGNGVDLFSIRYEDEDEAETLFERFVLKHQQDASIEEEFAELMTWLERMKRNGAKAHLFRPERKAEALPPKPHFRDTSFNKELRLYCMRISDRAVVLFDGDVKTAQRAKDCPNVRPHFQEANRLSEKLEEMLKERVIKLDEEDRLELHETSFEV